MTKEAIDKGNEIIAVFMGKPLTEWDYQYNESFTRNIHFKYHGDWNDLMEVVAKIGKIYDNGGAIGGTISLMCGFGGAVYVALKFESE